MNKNGVLIFANGEPGNEHVILFDPAQLEQSIVTFMAGAGLLPNNPLIGTVLSFVVAEAKKMLLQANETAPAMERGETMYDYAVRVIARLATVALARAWVITVRADDTGNLWAVGLEHGEQP